MTITTTVPETDPAATTRSVVHGSFTIERTYPHAPASVFAAWADPDRKRVWFGQGPDFVEKMESYELDVRIGGHERWHGRLLYRLQPIAGAPRAHGQLLRSNHDGRRQSTGHHRRVYRPRINE